MSSTSSNDTDTISKSSFLRISVEYLLVTFGRTPYRRVFTAVEVFLLVEFVVVVVTVPEVIRRID